MAGDYALDDAHLLAQCSIETVRAHGPGGQHVNRTESAVRLTHRASGAVSQCQDHRHRLRNQDDALRTLRLRLALVQRHGSDPGWLEPYRSGRRLLLGAKAGDYHLVVAVLLDLLELHGAALSDAAVASGLSSSQLVKLLCANKEVRHAADQMRQRFGLSKLK